MQTIDLKKEQSPLASNTLPMMQWAAAMSHLMTQMSACARTFTAQPRAGLGHLEQSLKKPMGEFLAAVLEKAAQEKADLAPPQCPKCGGKLIRRQRTERMVKTSFGQIKIQRVRGWCRKCKQWFCPADAALGLEGAYSPSVQEMAALFASKMPLAEASAVMERATGIALPPTTLDRVAKEAAGKAQALRRKLDEQARRGQGVGGALKAPQTLVIMMDAWNIRERDDWGRSAKLRRRGQEPQRWHWVWTGTVFSLEDRIDKGQRPLIINRGYAATRQGAQGLGEQLHAEATRRGLGRAQRVLVVADGAAWIWTLAQDRFQEAAQRVDLYHVKQHLWAVAGQLYAEPEKARLWVRTMKQRLRRGRGLKVLQSLQEALPKVPPKRRAAVAREINYLTDHQKRMDYDQAALRGEPLGSGAIEATCRQYQCRFKRPGQFWSPQGDEGLLCLETFWRNGRWDQLFPHVKGWDPSKN